MATKQKQPEPTTLHQDVHELFSGTLGKRVLIGLKKRYSDRCSPTLDYGDLAFEKGQRNVVFTLDKYATTNLEGLLSDGNANDGLDSDDYGTY